MTLNGKDFVLFLKGTVSESFPVEGGRTENPQPRPWLSLDSLMVNVVIIQTFIIQTVIRNKLVLVIIIITFDSFIYDIPM